MSKRYAILIDMDRCIGCHACTIACKMTNRLPQSVSWSQVKTIGSDGMDEPAGVYPNLQLAWLPMLCQHCEDAPCEKVCPVGAISKRDDGIVVLDEDKCIGCRYCMWACPYGAPQIDEEKHVVTKCHMCYYRVDQGKQPACVEACVYGARIFGDVNDPESKVSRLSAAKQARPLLPELGAKPAVRYAGRKMR